MNVQELYVQPYSSINWPSCRNNVAAVDMYAPHSKVANTLFAIVNAYEHFTPNFVRRRALACVYHQVVMEDENTAYQVC